MTKGWIECRVGDFQLEVDWSIDPGEVLVLFGPSGAGKSTTLRTIAGLLKPRRGHIEIAERTVYDSLSRIWIPAHKRRVGYLTQQYHLFPHLTVTQNIEYGLRNQPAHIVRQTVDRLVDWLQLNGMEDRRPWELSGGQQQRVAVARALAPGPDVLLLDEPFGAIDMELRRVLRRELRLILARSPTPVLLVTHDREEALAMADSVQVIDEGICIARGQPLEVLGQPGQSQVARLVGVENLFHLKVESRNPRDGTMICVGDGLRIEVPLDEPTLKPNHDMDSGGQVTVGIRASDIILAHEELLGSSARNQLCGVVTKCELRAPGYEITLDCGQSLRCHITGAALDEMQIRPGLPLWAVFKASSCFIVRDSPK